MIKRTSPIPGLPDSALLDCLFVTGKRGGGKSYSQRLGMERALSKGLRCGWVCALGVGWGITVAGDPKNLEKPIGPGYDVVVFGGEHGHMPLSPTAGAALGTMLAKAKFSWVIDLKLFKSKAQRVTFMADFMEAIYENCSAQLLLFLDEVDLWAPQIIFDKQGPAPRLLSAVDEIVRRGRIRGLSVWMATQRPAVVNKNVISQADGMLAFKTIAPQDTEAVMAWMKAHLKKTAYDEWLAQLPALKKGEAIIYLTEPEISIRRQQFPLIATLDTFKPLAGGKRQSDTLASKPDLEKLKSDLGALEEKIKADDPAHLKSEVARLTAELKKKPAPAPAAPNDSPKKEKWFLEGVTAGQRQADRQTAALSKIVQKKVEEMRRKISVILAGMARNAAVVENGLEALKRAAAEIEGATGLTFPELEKEMKALAKAISVGTPLPPAPAALPPRPAPAPMAPADGTKPLGKSEIRILGVLASRHPARFTMSQWATMASMKKTGGTWNTYVSRLRTAGYLDARDDGTYGVTDTGLDAGGGSNAQPQTRDEIIATWKKSLGSGPAKMMDALIAFYPDGMAREDLAIAVDMTPTGGTFNTYLSRLVSNLVVEVDKSAKTVKISNSIMEA